MGDPMRKRDDRAALVHHLRSIISGFLIVLRICCICIRMHFRTPYLRVRMCVHNVYVLSPGISREHVRVILYFPRLPMRTTTHLANGLRLNIWSPEISLVLSTLCLPLNPNRMGNCCEIFGSFLHFKRALWVLLSWLLDNKDIHMYMYIRRYS